MSNLVLFDADGHRNVLLPEVDAGEGVDTNQHLIIDGDEAMILDPGGSKLYTRVFAATMKEAGGGKLKYVFLSHQDPDIVASLNGWLMTTNATGLISNLWRRFIPHFGSDKLVYSRVEGIPDPGCWLKLGSRELAILPAHYLHSIGNFHVYDPTSKILYTGDLGVSLGEAEREVGDFDAHVPLMEGFHRRYMVSNKALKAWVKMVRGLDVEIVAPQHGALFRGKEKIGRLLDWLEDMPCGLDLMGDAYQVPAHGA